MKTEKSRFSIPGSGNVSANAPLIEVERTQQANTIDQRQIENLPNISRSFTDYIYTLPGVTNSDAPRAQNPSFPAFPSAGATGVQT